MNNAKKQIINFLSKGECSLTVITRENSNSDSTAYAHTLLVNDYIPLEEDNVSDGVLLRCVQNNAVVAETILAINNLYFLYKEGDLLVFSYTALTVNVEECAAHPFIVFQRK